MRYQANEAVAHSSDSDVHDYVQKVLAQPNIWSRRRALRRAPSAIQVAVAIELRSLELAAECGSLSHD